MPSSLSMDMMDWAYGGPFVRFATWDFGTGSITFSWEPNENCQKIPYGSGTTDNDWLERENDDSISSKPLFEEINEQTQQENKLGAQNHLCKKNILIHGMHLYVFNLHI